MHASIDVERVIALVKQDDNIGICTVCGHEQEGCEPDARQYPCEFCEHLAVYGAEELLIMMVA